MKTFLFVSVIALFSLPSYSQESSIAPFEHKNSFQVDLGEPGLFYSINYERILLNGGRFKTAAQIGASYYPPTTGIRDLWIPMGINELFSFGNHHLEAGIGYVLLREAARDSENNPDYWFWSHMLSGRIGYRYQKPGGHLILRAAFTPLLGFELSNNITEFHPMGGISVGYSF